MLKSDLENFPHAISGSSIIVIVKVVCKMSDSVTFTSVAAKGTICEKGGSARFFSLSPRRGRTTQRKKAAEIMRTAAAERRRAV